MDKKPKEDKCVAGKQHIYSIVSSQEAKRIRSLFPGMVYPIWKCDNCPKLVEST